MREKLKRLTNSPIWEKTVMGIILVNAITLGLETSPEIMSVYGKYLILIDQLVIVFFVIEIAMRIYANGLSFFRDPWGVFDFIIVAIALIPTNGSLSVLRSLRILRELRLISKIPSLKKVVGGLITALPGMGSIMLLLLLVFYLFSVMATKLFGQNFPEWFGSLGRSAYSLFQIMTLESWSMGLVRPIMEVHPYSWIFFVAFILSTAYTVLNLFTAIIVTVMQKDFYESTEIEFNKQHAETEDLYEEVKGIRTDLTRIEAKIQNISNESSNDKKS